MYSNSDTICALATPQGGGAIGIVRLSGKESVKIADSLFSGSLEKAEPYKMVYGSLRDGEKIIDDVLAAVFRSPRSYTGEDCVELYCHASSYIEQKIIMLLISRGARMAEPGEFSKRAFLNGKMDLTQAEAVADLIASQTAAAHKVALNQMRGGFSNELKAMREELLNLVSLMELELDFSEEDVEFADRAQLKRLLESVGKKIDRLIGSFSLGNVIKNGVPVAIVGATNTGKSTLLNALLGEEKAIVSDIHGTTRDVIEDCVNLNGITFRFIDTAGIRQTRETIEIIGIERTYTKLKQASVVILMLDAMRSDDFAAAIENLSSRFNVESQKLVIVLNKIDELEAALAAGVSVCGTAAPAGAPACETSGEGGSRADTGCADNGVAESSGNGMLSEAAAREIAVMVEKIKALSSPMGPIAVLPLSAKKGEGLDRLVEVITDSQKDMSLDSDAVLVTNARHFQALQSAKAALERVGEGLEAGTPTDLVAQDIREALYHIGTIAGEISTDEILGNIFGKFCIGK